MKNFSYTFTPSQEQRINDWIREQERKLVERQRGTPAELLHFKVNGETIPYTGSTGGTVTYRFTPTSLGTIVVVECLGEELDVTDYENW